MDRYFVFGNPIAHSQSPFIHSAFAEQTGQRLTYERCLCPLDGFAATVKALVGNPAQSGVRGANVTLPFKFEAFALAARTTERARLARAANALRFNDDGWTADNTDGVGLVRDIEHNAGVALAGRRVLVVGAGGSAAGLLGPLLARGPAQVVVANRTVSRALDLVDAHGAFASQHRVALQATALNDAGQAFDVVINATASSVAGAPVPVPPGVLRNGALAVDLMYGAAAAAFTDWAERHGAMPRDGLGMLVEQAAQAFEWFRGVRPSTAPVLAALRARLQGSA